MRGFGSRLCALAACLVMCVGCDRTAERTAQAKKDVNALGTALYVYQVDYGVYPTTAQGLNALITPAAGLKVWHGPYYQAPLPSDPWGHAYVYRSPGANGAAFDLFSCGPDGKEGTGDDVR